MNSCTWRAPSLSSATDVVDPGTPADVASGQQAQEAAMPTEQQQTVQAATPIDDYDAIAATAQRYIDGSAHGDAEKLADAFHPDAQMYGALSDHPKTPRGLRGPSRGACRHR